MPSWPTGTVTFLFTDIEGSTRRWEQDRELMAHSLERHDEILESAVRQHRGLVVKHLGDGLLAVFESAADAVQAAVVGQRGLAAEPWRAEPIRVRIGLHSGEAVMVPGDYLGPTVNRASRLMAAAWGDQILCSQATVELARDRLTEGLSFKPLGEHLLRDLAHPVALWQVVGDGLRTGFPDVRGVGAAGNLPTSLSSFVGREAEVPALVADLERARLLTLTGVGGVGKTRMALEVARVVSTDVPDGVWLCPLAPLGDPATIVGVLAGLFGLVQEPGRQLHETLVDHLRSKRLVVVLDNCEHLLDGVAELVDVLCGACPGLRVIATSREPLGMTGELIRSVRPLAADEAVALFVERARDIDPSFVADDASKDICRRLDGIPLAVEMAAARLRSMQPVEIASRLHERFRLLVGARRAAERQQTLRATVAWSHDLLNERERRVFRRLAVFAGSFDLPAAEAVTTDDSLDAVDVDDVLNGLVNKSLVVADHGGEGTRFSLLETIRQFAQEQLDIAGEGDARRREAAIFYSRVVQKASLGLRSADEARCADRIALEIDNLRAGWMWAVGAGDASLALALFAPMPPTGLAEPISYEIFTWIDPTLALPGASEDANFWPAGNWRCLCSLNLAEWDALQSWRTMCEQVEGAADRPEPHFADALLALIVKTDYPAAAVAYQAAAAAYGVLGDRYHEMRHRAMSLWNRLVPGPDEALLAEVELVAADARRLESPYMAAFAVGGPAAVPSFLCAEPQRALALFEEAVSYAVRSRNQFAYRIARASQAVALAVLGDPAALSLARDVLSTSRNNNQITLQLGGLSIAFCNLGLYRDAARIVGCLNGLHSTHPYWRNIPRVQEAWSEIRQALGDELYEACFAEGAACTNGEVVSWLRDRLNELAPRES